MDEILKILLLEDSDADAEIVSWLLKKEIKHCTLKLVMNKEDFLKALDDFNPDVILADNSLPQFSATEALAIVRQRSFYIPFILVTGTVSEEFAAGVIKLGADDYILKDRLARLPSAIESGLKQRRSAREKQEAQQKLILSEEKYRTQIERISDAFISLDEKFNYTYVNQQAGELIRRDPLSLIGKNIWEEFPDAVKSATYKDFNQAMSEQRYISNIDYYASLDLWQENHIYPSPDGLSIFIKDITIKKRAELALKNSEEIRRLIMNSALDAIICADESGSITVWNPQAEKMFGWQEKDILGKQLSETIIPPSYREMHRKGIERYILTGESKVLNKVFEITALHQSGNEFPIELAIVPLKQNGIEFFCAFIRDITFRKKAEIQLKESEEKYRTLVEQAFDGIMIYSLEGTILDFNHSAYTSMGYTRKEFEKLLVKDLFFKEELIKRPLSFSRLKEGRTTLDYRRLRKKDGSFVEMEIGTKMLPDGNFMAIARDITERKKAEEEIRLSNERYKTVAKATSDAIWDYDFATNKTFVAGSGYKDLFGYDIVNQYSEDGFWESRLHPDDKEKILSELAEVVANPEKNQSDSEYRFLKADGTYAYVNDRFFIIRDNGKPIRMLGAKQDITARKKSEEAIKKSNERFEMVASATNDVIWDWDLNSGSMWWNANFYSHFGYEKNTTAADISGWHNAVHAEDRERVIDGINVCIETRQFYWTDEYRFIKADGTAAFVLDRGYLLYNEEGKPYRMVGAMLDITERKRAEEKIQHSYEEIRQLASHLQEVREEERASMAREVHDELGQQLTGLKMDISWLNKKLTAVAVDASITDKIKDTMLLLDDAVKTVRKIATELRPSILDDLGLVAALEWQCDEFRKKSGITVGFTSDPFDKTIPENFGIALFRILQESLTNIARHSKAKNITVQLQLYGQQLHLDITDDGVGFVTSNIAGKKTLGLLGMKERTMMIGGSYRIDSKPGKGTSVHVIVPLPNT
ncbi:MAG: PAS domain S-box protein [Ferruginibacter sp.]